MFFTLEDLKKIEDWLKSRSKKDTEFQLAPLPLDGEEYVTLVLDAKNVKVKVSELAELLSKLANNILNYELYSDVEYLVFDLGAEVVIIKENIPEIFI